MDRRQVVYGHGVLARYRQFPIAVIQQSSAPASIAIAEIERSHASRHKSPPPHANAVPEPGRARPQSSTESLGTKSIDGGTFTITWGGRNDHNGIHQHLLRTRTKRGICAARAGSGRGLRQ
jgi:hypothetical protein